jgi:hypothetical protein
VFEIGVFQPSPIFASQSQSMGYGLACKYKRNKHSGLYWPPSLAKENNLPYFKPQFFLALTTGVSVIKLFLLRVQCARDQSASLFLTDPIENKESL